MSWYMEKEDKVSWNTIAVLGWGVLLHGAITAPRKEWDETILLAQVLWGLLWS